MHRLVVSVGVVALIGCAGDSGGDGSSGATQTATDTSAATTNTTETGTDTETTDTDSSGYCVEGDTQACYHGPDGTQDVGTCAAGIETCENGLWQPCEGATTPNDDEICDGLDDDCDGATDNACVMWHHQQDTSSVIYGLALDAEGNVFVAGMYHGENFELGGQRFTTQGNWELFVARFAPDGTHVWSRGMGSPADDELRGIALDGAGNLYITGSMHGGALVEGNMLPGFAGDDLFVAKYTVDGQHVWSNLYGSIGDEVGYDVAVDAEGGPVISGSFSGETNLGAGPVMAVGADDVFLLRLDPGGAPLWSKTAGSGDPQDDFGWAVAVFPGSGDILFGGAFRQTINLGGADLVADSRLDMFLARYTAAGDHVWSMSAGSGADDDVYGLDIDGDGNILLAGRSGSTVNFGTTPLGGIGQAIAAKLDGDGNSLWVRHSEGAPFQEDYATCMAVAAGPAGEVFVAGYVDGDINLGDTPDTEVGGAEIETFITKLDPDGAHEWSRAYGDDDNDYGWAVAAGADGQAIYGGALNSFEGRMFMTMFGASG